MLKIATQIDEETIERLMTVYSESMNDMRENFTDDAEMRAAYASFLRDFVKNPKQLIMAEASDSGEWVSALRAIEANEGLWFFEAVETKPQERRKGFGKALLCHTIDYLKNIGMTEVTCTVSKDNFASQALHTKCGFVQTDDLPVNCWGELEEGTSVYRFLK